MHECPRCDREYQKQGLHGHLRMGHGLRGDELERAYREALDGPEGDGCRSGASGRRKGEQREGKATDRRPVPSQDDRREGGHAQADPYQALERLCKARGRLRAAREETGSEESGAVISADKHPA